MSDPMTEIQMIQYMGTDAQRWAEQFLRIKAEIEQADDSRSTDDEGWMIGWFANAIEFAKDSVRAELRKVTGERDRARDLAAALEAEMAGIAAEPPEDRRIAEAEYARDFPQVMSNAECDARNWNYPADWRFDDE